MDSRDEKLTLENVDEQAEQCLAQSQEFQYSTVTPLNRTVRELQSIYEEDRRLEDVWARINSRVSRGGGQAHAPTLNAVEQVDELSGEEQTSTLNAVEQVNGLSGEKQASTLNAVEQVNGLSGEKQAPTFATIQGGKKALQDARGGSFNAILRRSDKQARLPFRRSWYTVGIGLVAAIILIVVFVWPIVSYALHGSWIAGPQPPMHKGTPQIQPTAHGSTQTGPKITPTTGPTVTPMVTPTSVATASPTAAPSPTTNVLPGIQVYSGQYFTIQYPADWVITSVTTGGGYVQTVQFRPSATSSVFVNVNVLYQSNLTSDLLLLADTDVKQGTLQSTNSVTYHGTAWTVGMVELSASTPARKLEIAYSNQRTPYRIEFGATSDTFSTYAPIFNAIFASFYPAS